MPTIRVSQRTWNRLKAHAKPLEDTPNDIISIALDALDEAKRKKGVGSDSPTSEPKIIKPKSYRSSRFSQKEIRILLLEALYGLGVDASARQVQLSIKRVLGPTLTEDDCEIVSNGNPRWWNAVCNVRNDLCTEGLLRGDSERGVWELSKQGRDFYPHGHKVLRN